MISIWKLLIVATQILLLFAALVSIRFADWAQHVSTPYLIAEHAELRCVRWEAANGLNELASKTVLYRPPSSAPLTEPTVTTWIGFGQSMKSLVQNTIVDGVGWY